MKSPLVIRGAIRKLTREAEEERIRKAYLAQPDSDAAVDDWATVEEWTPRRASWKPAE